jgi:hypothetical protein
MLEEVDAIPNLVGHTAVLCDFISTENRAAKGVQMKRQQKDVAKREKRAAVNAALYREWASQG